MAQQWGMLTAVVVGAMGCGAVGLWYNRVYLQNLLCSPGAPLENILTVAEHKRDMDLDFFEFILKNSKEKSPFWVESNWSIDEKRNEILQCYKMSNNDKNSMLSQNLSRCLETTRRVNHLFQDLEATRLQSFDVNNQQHIAVLRNLWERHVENETFTLNSKEWENLGFQGKNPVSDFRAGGFLAAKNLSHFALEYPEAYRRSLELVNVDKTYAPHAIVGIHVTMFVLQLFTEGLLHQHFVLNEVTEREFTKIYCYLFYKLIMFWVSSNPENVFAYNAVESKFFAQVRKQIIEQEGLVYLPSEFQKTME